MYPDSPLFYPEQANTGESLDAILAGFEGSRSRRHSDSALAKAQHWLTNLESMMPINGNARPAIYDLTRSTPYFTYFIDLMPDVIGRIDNAWSTFTRALTTPHTATILGKPVDIYPINHIAADTKRFAAFCGKIQVAFDSHIAMNHAEVMALFTHVGYEGKSALHHIMADAERLKLFIGLLTHKPVKRVTMSPQQARRSGPVHDLHTQVGLAFAGALGHALKTRCAGQTETPLHTMAKTPGAFAAFLNNEHIKKHMAERLDIFLAYLRVKNNAGETTLHHLVKDEEAFDAVVQTIASFAEGSNARTVWDKLITAMLICDDENLCALAVSLDNMNCYNRLKSAIPPAYRNMLAEAVVSKPSIPNTVPPLVYVTTAPATRRRQDALSQLAVDTDGTPAATKYKSVLPSDYNLQGSLRAEATTAKDATDEAAAAGNHIKGPQ